ncbi:Tn3 family transposase [Nonomuraea sp. NPDC050451]|uniref:Tn3 family transposase n=1 Tax=Nonomuraea sp. NPDC050451 TaxID=3364364 RepID=UPI003792F73C
MPLGTELSVGPPGHAWTPAADRRGPRLRCASVELDERRQLAEGFGQLADAGVNQVRADGFDVRDEDVARLSPFVRHHINMLGRYSFRLPDLPDLPDAMRPLRDPDAADE